MVTRSLRSGRVQATRQIRGLGVTTPIVGLSSDCRPPDVDAFLEAGADDFTPKVIDTCSLLWIRGDRSYYIGGHSVTGESLKDHSFLNDSVFQSRFPS